MSKISREFTVDSARSVAATGVLPAIEVSLDDGYAIETVFTGMAATASGTISLEVSLTGAAGTYAAYTSGSQNYASGTTCLVWEVTSKRHRYARLNLSAAGSGSGTCTTTFYGETFTD